MRLAVAAACLALLLSPFLLAQPAISPNGIVNAASFTPAGLPGGEIAQGSIFTIFGTGLGPAESPPLSWPLPTCNGLGGVMVNIMAGGNNYCAVLLFVSPGQINAILPSEAPLGPAVLTVAYDGGISNEQSIAIAAAGPGIFSRDQSGSGPGILTNWYAPDRQPLNTIAEAANEDEVGILWATGLGGVPGGDHTQTPLGRPLTGDIHVFVGGIEAQVLAKTRSGCCAGLDQVAFRYPANLNGCYAPVSIRVGNVVSPAVSAAVAPKGSRACRDPLSFGGLPAAQVAAGASTGNVVLRRTSTIMGASTPFNIETADASFVRWTADTAMNAHGEFGVSTPGACTTYSFRDDATVPSIAAQVSQDRYAEYLNSMLYTHTGDSRGLSGAQHNLARDNILAEFQRLGIAAGLDPFLYNGATYYNVVGVLPGYSRPQEVYVLGAHYDSANNAGADDDASGIAGVLEAARILSQHRFASTIMLAAFDREEQGAFGSLHMAEETVHYDIRGMVQLDMIAYNPPSPNHNAVWLYLGKAGADPAAVNALAAAFPLYAAGLTAVTAGAATTSDHAPFSFYEQPAVLAIEANPGGNPNYHKQADSADMPGYLDYGFASGITRAVAGYLAGAAEPVVPVAPAPGQGAGLDAGGLLMITASNSSSPTILSAAGRTGVYRASSVPPDAMSGLLPGTYRFETSGSAEVGAFLATLAPAAPLTFGTEDGSWTIAGTRGVKLVWSGGDPADLILIEGKASSARAGAGFRCLARNTGSFTVPPEALLALPPGTGSLTFSHMPAPSTTLISPAPSGLDAASFTWQNSVTRAVRYE